ncbi:MAG: VCBS repeat-containing protein, partial [Candidatus Eisenbacteria bacterium]
MCTLEPARPERRVGFASAFASFAIASLAILLLARAASANDVAEDSLRFTYPTVVANAIGPCAAADLDGDGVIDLLARGTGVAIILLGGAKAPLETRITVALEAGDSPTAIGDMDRDGRPDLITVRSADNSVAVYRNLGGLQFEAPARHVVATGPGGAWVGDVTGDGWPDLIVVGGSLFTTLLNQGDGSLAPGSTTAAGRYWNLRVVADLDGDGRADLAAVDFANELSVIRLLFGEADGTLSDGGQPAGSTRFQNAAAGDLDHDGNMDLILCASDHFEVWRGMGGRNFQMHLTQPGPAIRYIWPEPLLADFDGDSELDLVFATPEGRCYNGECPRILIFKGSGTGEFSGPARFLAAQPNYSDRVETEHAVMGDFDGDGAIDVSYEITSAYRPGITSFAKNDRSGGFLLPFSDPLGFRVRRVRVANSSHSGVPTVLLWDGTRTLQAHGLDGYRLRTLSPLSDGKPMGVADLNGDGLEDVIVASSDSTRIVLADGIGGFGAAQILTGGRFLSTADLDGILGPDIVVVDAVGAMHARYNDGHAAFGPLVDLALNLPLEATSVAGLDLDQDGYSELLIGVYTYGRGQRARVDVHWNTAGSLGATVGIDIGWVYPYDSNGSPSTIARGDFNGDGISDVMVVLETVGATASGFAVILGRGDRTFAPSVDYP